MNRKEFLTAAVSLSMCMCGGIALRGQEELEADNPEIRDLKNKIAFMQSRVARLVEALDEPTRQRVLETMGRECAKEFSSLIDPFKGKPEAFLANARKIWMESASYDPETGAIHVVDRGPRCTCAFVQPGLTPADFCTCTLGWQKEAYSMILGEEVDAELESSILRGGSNCSFRICPKARPTPAG